jgi:hypothetical protein
VVVFRQIFTPADCVGNEYAVSYHVASSFTFPNKLPSSFLKQMSAKSVYVGYLVYFLFVVGLVVIVETSAADLVQEFFGGKVNVVVCSSFFDLNQSGLLRNKPVAAKKIKTIKAKAESQPCT